MGAMRSMTRWHGGLVLLGISGMALAACSPSSPRGTPTASAPRATAQPSSQLAAVGPPSVSVSPSDGSAAVGLDTALQVTATNASVSSVSVQEDGSADTLSWTTADAGAQWTWAGGLDLDATYTVTATVVAPDGGTTTASSTFHTITSAKRLLTSVTPGDGSTVGVGAPIDLHFNTPIPQADQQGIIDHVAVTSNPPQPGGWYWFDDQNVHYRPESFWQTGTHVTVDAQLKGVDAGNGYWGLGSWSESFTIGPAHFTVVNVVTRQLQLYNGDPSNGGQLLDTWSTNTGKPGFDTIGGTLVVLYHTPDVLMDSCSTFHTASACTPGTSNYYHENVYEDTAVSSDGYFIHAAPWVCGQNAPVCDLWPYGNHNTSHGCINLNVDNATFYYGWSQVGDVVEVSGSPLQASYSDGEGDWQTPWSSFVQGGQEVSPAGSTSGSGAPSASATPTPSAARP